LGPTRTTNRLASVFGHSYKDDVTLNVQRVMSAPGSFEICTDVGTEQTRIRMNCTKKTDPRSMYTYSTSPNVRMSLNLDNARSNGTGHVDDSPPHPLSPTHPVNGSLVMGS
jgi:hypothetical protein